MCPQPLLSPQGDYDGGELVVEDTFGTDAVKLGAATRCSIRAAASIVLSP